MKTKREKMFKFLAYNRKLELIFTSHTFKTKNEAYKAGCEYLQQNFEVKEISVRKGK